MNTELLKLFNIDYEKPAGSIKLTFRITPIQCTKYSVFIENAYDYYCKKIVSALNLPSINYMDVLSEEEFAYKSDKAFKQWAETYKDMERAYRHISDAFRFPYVLTKKIWKVLLTNIRRMSGLAQQQIYRCISSIIIFVVYMILGKKSKLAWRVQFTVTQVMLFF